MINKILKVYSKKPDNVKNITFILLDNNGITILADYFVQRRQIIEYYNLIVLHNIFVTQKVKEANNFVQNAKRVCNLHLCCFNG